MIGGTPACLLACRLMWLRHQACFVLPSRAGASPEPGAEFGLEARRIAPGFFLPGECCGEAEAESPQGAQGLFRRAPCQTKELALEFFSLKVDTRGRCAPCLGVGVLEMRSTCPWLPSSGASGVPVLHSLTLYMMGEALGAPAWKGTFFPHACVPEGVWCVVGVPHAHPKPRRGKVTRRKCIPAPLCGQARTGHFLKARASGGTCTAV